MRGRGRVGAAVLLVRPCSLRGPTPARSGVFLQNVHFLSCDGDRDSQLAAWGEDWTRGSGCCRTAFALVFLPSVRCEKPLGHSEPFWNSVLRTGTSPPLVPAMLASLPSARSVSFAVLAAPFPSVSVFPCVKNKITFVFSWGFKGKQGYGQSAL